MDRKKILTNILLSKQDFDMEGKYHDKWVYDIVKKGVDFNWILYFIHKYIKTLTKTFSSLTFQICLFLEIPEPSHHPMRQRNLGLPELGFRFGLGFRNPRLKHNISHDILKGFLISKGANRGMKTTSATLSFKATSDSSTRGSQAEFVDKGQKSNQIMEIIPMRKLWGKKIFFYLLNFGEIQFDGFVQLAAPDHWNLEHFQDLEHVCQHLRWLL